MPLPSFRARGVEVPALLYGTAWKEDATANLVRWALEQGFRGIDSANQRRHYHEAAAGAAVQAATSDGTLPRSQLFLQSKFTFREGQDHRLPYDPGAPVAEQVAQSFASTLRHYAADTLDGYLLHGPSQPVGLGPRDWEAWEAMERLHRQGRVRAIGVSNVSADQLDALLAGAAVPPAIVQNRCLARPHADAAVREACREHGLVYQGFSLLTGHRTLAAHPDVHAAARRLGATVPQVVYRACLDHGLVVLTGTTSAHHMAQALAVADLELPPADLATVGRLAGLSSPA